MDKTFRYSRGEITTIIILGSAAILSITSLVTTLIIRKQQITTEIKAGGTIPTQTSTCTSGIRYCKDYCSGAVKRYKPWWTKNNANYDNSYCADNPITNMYVHCECAQATPTPIPESNPLSCTKSCPDTVANNWSFQKVDNDTCIIANGQCRGKTEGGQYCANSNDRGEFKIAYLECCTNRSSCNKCNTYYRIASSSTVSPSCSTVQPRTLPSVVPTLTPRPNATRIPTKQPTISTPTNSTVLNPTLVPTSSSSTSACPSGITPPPTSCDLFCRDTYKSQSGSGNYFLVIDNNNATFFKDNGCYETITNNKDVNYLSKLASHCGCGGVAPTTSTLPTLIFTPAITFPFPTVIPTLILLSTAPQTSQPTTTTTSISGPYYVRLITVNNLNTPQTVIPATHNRCGELSEGKSDPYANLDSRIIKPGEQTTWPDWPCFCPPGHTDEYKMCSIEIRYYDQEKYKNTKISDWKGPIIIPFENLNTGITSIQSLDR